MLSIGNLAILGLHYLHLLEEHLDAVLLFEEVKLAWVLKAVNFLLLREILLGKRWSLSNFKERRHFFVLYLIRGSNWSCMRAHCTILEQGLGFLDKLSQLVIGDVGIKWSDGTTLGSHVGHFLSKAQLVGLLDIFFLIQIKLVDFLLGGVKQVPEDLVFMLKGILRVFTRSFFEKDTLVLWTLFRLGTWNRDALWLLGDDGVLQLGGLDCGPELG